MGPNVGGNRGADGVLTRTKACAARPVDRKLRYVESLDPDALLGMMFANRRYGIGDCFGIGGINEIIEVGQIQAPLPQTGHFVVCQRADACPIAVRS
jgi:hypothetical protein